MDGGVNQNTRKAALPLAVSVSEPCADVLKETVGDPWPARDICPVPVVLKMRVPDAEPVKDSAAEPDVSAPSSAVAVNVIAPVPDVANVKLQVAEAFSVSEPPPVTGKLSESFAAAASEMLAVPEAE